MQREVLLFTPGPTRVHPKAQEEINRPMIHHRSEEFERIFASLRNNLHLLSQTDGEALVLSGSGTAAMEAVTVSLFSPSDHVVIVDTGKFGKRWVNLAQRYRLSFTLVQKTEGTAASVEDVLQHVQPHTKAVWMQACESSTGVYNPVEAIGKALLNHPNVMFMVDAITAFGIYPMSTRAHNIDVLIAASQKALMCPPGLALVILSEKAVGRLQPSQSLYLSLLEELHSQKENHARFTPAVSLIRGLEKTTEIILNEGMKKVFERHQGLQRTTREFFRLLGLPCLASDEEASLGITAVKGIPGLDIEHWLTELREDEGVLFASGQGNLRGQIFRIAHMGYCSEQDLVKALSLVAKSLQKILPTDRAQKFLNR